MAVDVASRDLSDGVSPVDVYDGERKLIFACLHVSGVSRRGWVASDVKTKGHVTRSSV